MDVLEWSPRQRFYFQQAKEQWGEQLAYEQSWLYVCQALRHGGWILKSTNGWMAVARDYLGPQRHAVVVPLSNDLATFLRLGLRELRARGVVPSIIKHVSEEKIESVKSIGGLQVTSRVELTPNTFLDDLSEDRLPQILLDVDPECWAKVNAPYRQWVPRVPVGSGAGEFRHQLWRFCRNHLGSGANLGLESIGIADNESVERVLQNWTQSLSNRMKRAGRSAVRNFHRCFVEPVQAAIDYARHSNGETSGQVVSVGGQPSALWIGSRVSDRCFAMNVLLADSMIKSLSYFTAYLAYLRAQELGASWVNLGGSEVESLFNFKLRAAGVASVGQCVTRRVWDLELVDNGSTQSDGGHVSA